ncbi:hypothetical protein M951_chr191 (nucleomorph) [Lotharella oceanica]|uniref:Uncharacterized protein n=1 Tax=Lotharella oceanica TaxID=641309 RepID=A0A060DGA7_9EUKA|nr:hypothetical protein M951_chr171 [Lotharella oceanica]AIB09561.1 hypothetical protein M951_chr176 [Lotharella oceanica]AIB09565.1 hypothetical protein M951_chr181 [Lotharella oceanica]AIB09569.1 hypothetical protein M951_chr186 [Lotharella oceanica]AIB09573.1 hypothetical protein M951_chr191 [Lotharella oceanica]
MNLCFIYMYLIIVRKMSKKELLKIGIFKKIAVDENNYIKEYYYFKKRLILKKIIIIKSSLVLFKNKKVSKFEKINY